MRTDQEAKEFGRSQAVATLREAADCSDNRLSHRLLDTVERELGKNTNLRIVAPNEIIPVPSPPGDIRAVWVCVVVLGALQLGELLWPLLDKVAMLSP